MFLKILPDLDMPLISLDTKNHYPKFNGLGDMVIVISKTLIPFFFGTPCSITTASDLVSGNITTASDFVTCSITTASDLV